MYRYGLRHSMSRTRASSGRKEGRDVGSRVEGKSLSEGLNIEMTGGDGSPASLAVEAMYKTGTCEGIELTASDERKAIELLAGIKKLFIFEELIAGAERLSESIHSVPTRGLQEIVQNAEDQQATHLRFGFRKRGTGPAQLLIVHDGNPVVLEDVIRMAIPLISGSRGNAEKIGQFGVGLRTLRRLGRTMEVHCHPLPSFAIRDGRIHTAKAEKSIKGFWNAEARETLFVLHLEDKEVTLDFLSEWLESWDSSSLLFLDHVSSVELVSLGRGRKTVRKCSVRRGESRQAKFDLARTEGIREQVVSEVAGNRRWTRYTARIKAPKRLRDPEDGIGETLDVRVAVPNRKMANRVYVGLPLEEENSLPYAVGSKHFKLSVDRTDLLKHDRNAWLIKALVELGTSVAQSRLLRSPKTAWRSIVLSSEVCGNSPWVKEQFREAIETQWKDLSRRGSIQIDGSDVLLDDLAFEIKDLEGILDTEDVTRLWFAEWDEHRLSVPKKARDGGRWREVLSDPSCSARPLDFEEAIHVFGWDHEELNQRGDGWMVDLVAAGLRNEASQELEACSCIPLAKSAGRVSPKETLEKGVLLVHSLEDEGLASTLGLAEQICPKLRATSESSGAVRSWLSELGALKKRANNADAIRAIARGDGTNPRDLSDRDDVLKQLKNSFDQLPAEERGEIGPGVGRNIFVVGHIFKNGKKVKKKTRPADAYLPAGIDSGPFSRAAGSTPGLEWIQPRYKDLLSGVRGQGALAFLRSLGAASAPRLLPADPPKKDPHLRPLIQSDALCAQHIEELTHFPKATGLSEDFVSPDAEAVALDIKSEKRLKVRRSRARDFVLALQERWAQYEDRLTADAVYHYYSFITQGEVSATWLARLASAKWMTTREPGLHPASPRDLSVLTETTFEIEGDDLSKYSGELESDDAGLSAVEALGIRGSREASDVIAQLEELKRGWTSTDPTHPQLADRCLLVLEEFVSGGKLESESDLSSDDIRFALTDPGNRGGLIYVEGAWRSPTEIRLGPPMHPSLPCTNLAPSLMKAIGVQPPTAAECIRVLTALAVENAEDRTGEFRALERLIEIEKETPKGLTGLKRAPLRLTDGWTRKRGKDPVFATSNSTLTGELGKAWRVWDPPMPIARLGRLTEKLGVVPIGQDQCSPHIPQTLRHQELDQQDDFDAAVARFRSYLTTHHVDLHSRITPEAWRKLKNAKVLIGQEWGINVKVPGKQARRVPLRAQCFSEPNVLCVTDEEQLGLREGAGQAVAAMLGGATASEADLSTLALVWAETYEPGKGLEFSIDPFEEPEIEIEHGNFEGFNKLTQRGKGRPGKQKKPSRRKPLRKENERRLHNFDELDLSEIEGMILDGKRMGSNVRIKRKNKLKKPSPPGNRGPRGQGTRAGNTLYTDEDRETLAFEIVATALAQQRDVDLEDIRDQHNVGADAVDRDRDIWVELKAHGKDMPDSVRFEPSEFELAHEKRGKYLLAVVWGLEAGRKPGFVLIPDPVFKLDRLLSSKVQLRGISDMVHKSL